MANPIEGRPINRTSVETPSGSVPGAGSSYQRIQDEALKNQALPPSSSHPASLEQVTQGDKLPADQRLRAWYLISQQAMSQPSSPYCRLEGDKKNMMCEMIAGVFVDTPDHPLPKSFLKAC